MPISKTLLKNQALMDLMKKANDNHEGVMAAESRAAEAAIDCGMALLEARDIVPHGRWGKFVKAAFSGGERTAQRYMRVAKAVSEGTVLMDGTETIFDLEDAISQMEREAEAPEPTIETEKPSQIEDDKGDGGVHSPKKREHIFPGLDPEVQNGPNRPGWYKGVEMPPGASDPVAAHWKRNFDEKAKRAKIKRGPQPARDLDAARKAIEVALSYYDGKRKERVAKQLHQAIDLCVAVEPKPDEFDTSTAEGARAHIDRIHERKSSKSP